MKCSLKLWAERKYFSIRVHSGPIQFEAKGRECDLTNPYSVLDQAINMATFYVIVLKSLHDNVVPLARMLLK